MIKYRRVDSRTTRPLLPTFVARFNAGSSPRPPEMTRNRLGDEGRLEAAGGTRSNIRFRRIEPRSVMQCRIPLSQTAHPRDIASLEERIAKSTRDGEAWRSAGFSEKYLEACSLTEAMLADLIDVQGRTRTIETMRSPDEPIGPPAAASDSDNREQLMADLSIAYDGRRYYYETYRYDRLEDALSYARLQRSRAANGGRVPMPTPSRIEPPDERQRTTMTLAGITYEKGVYRLGEYRYDRLDDALAYAHLQHPI